MAIASFLSIGIKSPIAGGVTPEGWRLAVGTTGTGRIELGWVRRDLLLFHDILLVVVFAFHGEASKVLLRLCS